MDGRTDMESTHYLLHCESGNLQIADRITVHRRSWLSEEHALPGECVSSHNQSLIFLAHDNEHVYQIEMTYGVDALEFRGLSLMTNKRY